MYNYLFGTNRINGFLKLIAFRSYTSPIQLEDTHTHTHKTVFIGHCSERGQGVARRINMITMQ